VTNENISLWKLVDTVYIVAVYFHPTTTTIYGSLDFIRDYPGEPVTRKVKLGR